VGARRARTFPKPVIEGNIMNIHKHMEAIFVVTLAVIGVGTLVIDSLPEAAARPAAPVAHKVANKLATPGTMAVVIVRAPRAPRAA
jgi:hypothetical protein